MACRYFVEGRTRAELDNDLLFYYAVAKAVKLIGAAAWQVSGPTRAENPDIAWDRISGMRHRQVHGFQRIVRDVLWIAAQQGVPPLIAQLQAALVQHES